MIDPLGLSLLDWAMGREGWIPDYAQGRQGIVPDLLQQGTGQVLSIITTAAPTSDSMAVATAGSKGLKTGGKAVVNASSKTIVSTVTLGMKDGGDLITVTDADRASGYDMAEGFARGGTEILMGVATAGLLRSSNVGKAVLAMDVGSAVVGGTNAAMEIRENGINLSSGADLSIQLLSLAGNIAGIKAKQSQIDEVKVAAKSVDNSKNLISRQGPLEMTGNKVKKYRKKLKEDNNQIGKDYPPIDVADVDGKRIIIDGHHRTESAVREGVKEVPIKINDVSKTQAEQLLRDAAHAASERR